ncbi:hypothetical protein OS31_31080 [Dickeya oryzae]
MFNVSDIILDLGANVGGFSLEVARRNPNIIIHAIEPYPKLADTLIQKAKDECVDNHIVHQVAISDEEGEHTFNISSESDGGTSSLLDFSKEHLQQDEYWATRIDLKYSEKIKVNTMPLEHFLDGLVFDRILFIKIDIQGLDLTALKSAGKYLSRIDAGMLEVPATKDCSLYAKTDDDLYSALKFLNENGFKIHKIKPNDPASNEFNVFFCRNELSYETLEGSLSLREMHYYDGKHYWHFPSFRQEYPEEHIVHLTNALAEAREENSQLKMKNDEYLEMNSIPLKKTILYKFFKLFKKSN